jgi:hypothetical protein
LCEFFIAQFENENPASDEDELAQVSQLITDYLHHRISYTRACALFSSISTSSTLFDRIHEVVETSDEAAPAAGSQDSTRTSRRREMKMWTHGEDIRLLSGIYQYGLNTWAPIAKFVGHSRTRAQCAQRWNRVLDPRIAKDAWGATEDSALLSLVRACGERSWMQISSFMKNRSDVQCRYRYRKLKRKFPEAFHIARQLAPGVMLPFTFISWPRPPPIPIEIPETRPLVTVYRTVPKADEKSERVCETPEGVRDPGLDLIANLLNVH